MAKLIWAVVGIIGGGALGWYALRGVDWIDTLHSLAIMDWRPLTLAVGAILLASVLEAVRWKLLLPAERVSAKRLLLVKFVGKGLNNLSPIRIISEVAQTTMLRYGDGVGTERIVSSLLLVRLFDLFVTVSLVGAGLIVLPQLSGLRPIVLPLWAISIVSVIALVLLAKRLHRLPAVRRFSIAHSLLVSLGAAGSRRKALLGAFALTAVAWMSMGLAAWLVASAAGIHLPLWLMAVVIVAVSFVSSAVPAPPGAVGVYEFAAISTLGLFAVDASAALTFALVIHAFIFVPPVLIAVAVLATERKTLGHVAMAVRQVIQVRRKPAVSPVPVRILEDPRQMR